jgi:RNA polymerase sigma-70 factor (ECF subfamily)
MGNETNPTAGLSYSNGKGSVLMPDPDAPLVARCRGGDLDAFEQLVLRHQKRMLNIAYRMIGDYDEACEAVQDAFVAAHKNFTSFRGDAKFSTWLTSVTLNHAKNRLKQVRTRSSRIAFSLNAPVETDDGEKALELPSKEPSQLDRLERKDVKKHVRFCIEALEPDYREVIILRDVQDFSYEEIGAALKVREGTVKSRLFRAREAVKDCLKKALGEL